MIAVHQMKETQSILPERTYASFLCHTACASRTTCSKPPVYPSCSSEFKSGEVTAVFSAVASESSVRTLVRRCDFSCLGIFRELPTFILALSRSSWLRLGQFLLLTATGPSLAASVDSSPAPRSESLGRSFPVCGGASWLLRMQRGRVGDRKSAAKLTAVSTHRAMARAKC